MICVPFLLCAGLEAAAPELQCPCYILTHMLVHESLDAYLCKASR